jgi:hypothetical protein
MAFLIIRSMYRVLVERTLMFLEFNAVAPVDAVFGHG